MSQIIMFPQQPKGEGIIDVSNVQKSCRKLKAGLIAPATETVQSELAREHAAEPIKSMDEIVRVSQFLIEQKRFRDNMLFIAGLQMKRSLIALKS